MEHGAFTKHCVLVEIKLCFLFFLHRPKKSLMFLETWEIFSVWT